MRTIAYKNVETSSETIEFLRKNKVLRDKFFCKVCQRNMKMIGENSLDGYIMRCNGPKCEIKKKIIRDGPVFDGIKTSLVDIVKIIYEWCQETSMKNM